MVMEGIAEDMGEGNMQCPNHPYKNSAPGGICAFCLQEKLGKLVSSSSPSAIFPHTSSSSTPSFRSDFVGTSSTAASTLPLQTHNKKTPDSSTYHPYHTVKKSRMPFMLAQKKKKNIIKEAHSHSSNVMASSSSSSSRSDAVIVFKRSKSTTTPRNRLHFLESDESEGFSPRRKLGFWSFLYYSSSKHSSSSTATKTNNKPSRDIGFPKSSVGSSVNGGSMRSRGEKKKEGFVVVEENESPNEAAFDRKVSRSRSVGCGSRSFSGHDLFEKISTGLGDCTLRRVESQREGKHNSGGGGTTTTGQHCIKERVNCGGIFSGFMIASSSSSSSSSTTSSYCVSSEEKSTIAPASVGHNQLAHGRSKSWACTLASPMRAFSKQSSSGKRREASNKNATPNLAAIPSLLTVSS